MTHSIPLLVLLPFFIPFHSIEILMTNIPFHCLLVLVLFNSVRPHLHTTHKLQLPKKYSVIRCNLSVESNTYTSQSQLLLISLYIFIKKNLYSLVNPLIIDRYNIFQIAFVVLAGLTFVYYAAFVSFTFPPHFFFYFFIF